MTKKERNRHFINISIGCVLFILGITGISDEYYALMACVGGATFFANAVLPFFSNFYYRSPKRRKKYEERLHKRKINYIDERKKFLRDKAAHVSYMFMWMILLLLAFILTLLKVEWWVAAMLAGLSVLQYLIASVAFFYLERKM